MESVHLYFLLYQTSLQRRLQLNVPLTLIRGYGFENWTWMYTRHKVLRFRRAESDHLAGHFQGQVQVRVNSDCRVLPKSHLARRLAELCKEHSNCIVQEYLVCQKVRKELTVKWNGSSYLVALLKEGVSSLSSESFISLAGWQKEMLRIINLIKSALEAYYPTVEFRMLQLSFCMDASQKWKLVALNSYKSQLQRPSTPKQRQTTHTLLPGACTPPVVNKSNEELAALVDKVQSHLTQTKLQSSLLNHTVRAMLQRTNRRTRRTIFKKTLPKSESPHSDVEIAVQQLDRMKCKIRSRGHFSP